ncbi:MAG: hypothetical protein ACK47M_18080, partial [Caldilinea sp.]
GTNGYGLTLQAGGAKSATADLNGGDLTLSSGTATGTGSSNIYFKTATAGATGTADRAPTTAMTILGNNNVGIGTASPAVKLDVAGTIVSRAANVASGGTVDLSTSNTVTLASVGGSTITLSNMVNGGNYTLVVQDTNSRTYTFSGCNTSKFRPANAATTAASHTIYNILTLYNGATYDCYITWTTGYL